MNQNKESVHTSQEERDQHWAGEYFGPNGVVSKSKARYDLARSLFDRTGSFHHQAVCVYLASLMAYMSTLYSALGHSISMIKRFDLRYLFHAMDVFDELSTEVLPEVLRFKEHLTPGEKEVLMAVLLVPPYRFSPKYRNIVRGLGDEIISSFQQTVGQAGGVVISTYLLACARLSSMEEDPSRKENLSTVKNAIYSERMQKELGWKTVNRLARLIGDKQMVLHSAKMDGSKDVLLKSGV